MISTFKTLPMAPIGAKSCAEPLITRARTTYAAYRTANLLFDLAVEPVRPTVRRPLADRDHDIRLFCRWRDATSIARIDAASFARSEAHSEIRPVEQKRLVVEIDQSPKTGGIHRAADVLNQKIEGGVGRWRQLLEGEELAQVGGEGDEIAAPLGGFLAQHVPEAAAHVRRDQEQQGRAITGRCLRHKRRELVLARRAPAFVLRDEQPIRPAAVKMKVRHDREGRLPSA